jgi:hypothetical protein
MLQFCRKIHLIGFLKCNSLSIPEVLKDVKLWGKVAKRGDFKWFRRENFVYVQWKDCKVVTFMSPLHQGSAFTQCKRTIKSRTSWKKRELVEPSVANDYNMHGSCWFVKPVYKQIPFKYTNAVSFFLLLDITIVNSYILFQEFRRTHESNFPNFSSSFGQLEFRESLAHSLVGLSDSHVSVHSDTASKCIPEFGDKRTDCIYCNAEAILVVLKKRLPSYKTSVFCQTCNVPLCLTKEIVSRNGIAKMGNLLGSVQMNLAKKKETALSLLAHYQSWWKGQL